MSKTADGDETLKMLRKGISQSDTIPCKDFRLCCVEVFESIYLSDDNLWDMEDKLIYLEELYEKYPPNDDMMDELMEIFREEVGKRRRGVKV